MSKDNEKVLDKLVKEVRGLNPTFNSADVRGEFMPQCTCALEAYSSHMVC